MEVEAQSDKLATAVGTSAEKVTAAASECARNMRLNECAVLAHERIETSALESNPRNLLPQAVPVPAHPTEAGCHSEGYSDQGL